MEEGLTLSFFFFLFVFVGFYLVLKFSLNWQQFVTEFIIITTVTFNLDLSAKTENLAFKLPWQ
jgi:hypothetical protein